VVKKCCANYESKSKKAALEWLDCMTVDLEDIEDNVGAWAELLKRSLVRIRKKKSAKCTDWYKNYQSQVSLFQLEKS